jgi:hypothetical protein
MQMQDWGATSTRPGGERPSWKVIWNNHALPKVKLLTWKICCNALSTQTNMARRGMATTSLCQICEREARILFMILYDALMPKLSG